MNPLLLLLVGGGLLAAYMTAGKRLSLLELQPTALTINKSLSNLQYSVFNLTVSVYNPNEEALTLEKFIGTIYYDSSRLSDLDPQQNAAIKIPGRGEKELKYTVKVKNTGIPGALYTYLFSDKPAASQALIKGTLYAENMKIPISQKVSLTL